MDGKTKAKIINSLRKLTFSFTHRSQAKKEAQVDKALFRCKSCSVLIYEGSSQENYQKHLDNYKVEIRMEHVHMDHIEPIVDPVAGWQGWDSYITRMFCEKDGWQALCSVCHTVKSKAENSKRTITRKSKKKS